jgi:hypothetical protein
MELRYVEKHDKMYLLEDFIGQISAVPFLDLGIVHPSHMTKVPYLVNHTGRHGIVIIILVTLVQAGNRLP